MSVPSEFVLVEVDVDVFVACLSTWWDDGMNEGVGWMLSIEHRLRDWARMWAAAAAATDDFVDSSNELRCDRSGQVGFISCCCWVVEVEAKMLALKAFCYGYCWYLIQGTVCAALLSTAWTGKETSSIEVVFVSWATSMLVIVRGERLDMEGSSKEGCLWV